MFIKPGMSVRAVNLPTDVNLDDVAVTVQDAAADVTLWFVTNSAGLTADLPLLEQMWRDGGVFWVFYPKKPHLDTDLGRDKVQAMMMSNGMRGTRQVGIDDLWSCLYFKAK